LISFSIFAFPKEIRTGLVNGEVVVHLSRKERSRSSVKSLTAFQDDRKNNAGLSQEPYISFASILGCICCAAPRSATGHFDHIIRACILHGARGSDFAWGKMLPVDAVKLDLSCHNQTEVLGVASSRSMARECGRQII